MEFGTQDAECERVCAIVVADVVASTKVSSAKLKSELNKTIRNLLHEWNGRFNLLHARSIGDGFIICAPSPVDVARLALDARYFFSTNDWNRLGSVDN
jgi:class 3 adenylate cyclase